ncbi:MAG: Na+-transporting NADH:ubiquinone oxidoreductase subunit C [Bacteroidia bacterium]
MSKLNKNSESYIFGFALVVIILCGVLLSTVSGALAEKQKEERELERMRFILKSALDGERIDTLSKPSVALLYGKIVKESVLNQNGEVVEGKMVNEVVVAKEYKKLDKQGKLNEDIMYLPLYTVMSETNVEEISSYVVPTFGYGLWDNIWAYVAIQKDFNTIQGVVLDHKGETPGLGARITEDKVQNRFQNKKIYDENQNLVSVKMMKGENTTDYSDKPHKVDGLSGATLTANGVSKMFAVYLKLYEPYIQKNKN